MALLSVEDAVARLLADTSPIDRIETLPLDSAAGRILAHPVQSLLTQPPFDASAMDGYAVRADDVRSVGAKLRLIGESAAGRGFSGTIAAGETVRIFTGAPVPAGADTVLLQEDAERHDDGWVSNRFCPERGRHIRPRGQDFTLSETVLDAGMRLDFGRLMVAAAMNHPQLPVYHRPKIAILATGDELVAPGGQPGEHQIIGSSSVAIATLARAAGAEVIDLGIVGDQSQAIADRVNAAKQTGIDILVTLGGASVGDHDLVQATLKSIGMRLDFWRIAMRPGKPLMVGSLDGVRVLGLPGNPVSSMVCALLFLEPLIAKMARTDPARRQATALTVGDLSANDQRQDYLRATLARDAEGRLRATSFGKQDSSQMKIFSRADCLIVRPPHAEAAKAGSEVPILVLR